MGLEPSTIPLDRFCEFLHHLFTQGKLPGTVAGYRAACRGFIRPFADGSTLDDNPLIAKMIRGMYVKRPPSRQLAQPWDLKLVLDSLLRGPYKGCSSLSLSMLTHKTAFLLALATMCRGSELHALTIDGNHCRFSNGGVFLSYNSTFLAKNERANVTHKELFVPCLQKLAHDENKTWCPVTHLREYIDRTHGLRAGDCDQLFITTIDPFTPASKASIARWVVSVIRQGYEFARIPLPSRITAHQVRAVASSTALFTGFSLKQVLEAANWASQNTFINCYLREIPMIRAGARAAAFLGNH
jgi:integrase